VGRPARIEDRAGRLRPARRTRRRPGRAARIKLGDVFFQLHNLHNTTKSNDERRETAPLLGDHGLLAVATDELAPGLAHAFWPHPAQVYLILFLGLLSPSSAFARVAFLAGRGASPSIGA